MPDKHLLVVSQYFYPEQFRINDICLEWVKKGYKVTVLTGIPNYPQGKFYKGYGFFKKRREFFNGIEIIRIPLIPRGNSKIMLALNYLSFVASGFFWSFFTKLNADIVFIYQLSPMTQALLGVWYANLREVPCYLYVMDLWPESVDTAAGITNKKIINTIGAMVDYIYKRCNVIFTSSESFIEAIASRGIDEQKIKFWPQYAEDFYMPLYNNPNTVPQIPNDDRLNLIFAGNIGYAQGLEILPKTALILKSRDKKVRFNIVGDGRFKENFIKMTIIKGVEEMFNFIDLQPAYKISEYMAACDVALIILSDSKASEVTLPAKLQSCLACGIPIIVSANGEVQNVIKESQAGLFCNASDPDSLAQIIIEMISKTKEEMALLSTNARKYYEENYDKTMLLNKMDDFFLRGSGL